MRIIIIIALMIATSFLAYGEKRTLKDSSSGLGPSHGKTSPQGFFGDDFFGDDFFDSDSSFQKQIQEMRKRFRRAFSQDPSANGLKSFSIPFTDKTPDLKQYQDDEFYYYEIPKKNKGESNFKVKVEKDRLIIESTHEDIEENIGKNGNKSYRKSTSSSSRIYRLGSHIDTKGYDVEDKKDKLVIKFRKNKNTKKRRKMKTKQDDFV